jgi:hypothetical protein
LNLSQFKFRVTFLSISLLSIIPLLKLKIMKRDDKTSAAIRNFDQLISKFSENEILDTQTMIHVRGGDGEGNGGDDIIIVPKPK